VQLVLDTNIVVSALIWGGTPYRLLQAATSGDIALFTSPVLLQELRDVLAREHLAARLRQKRASVEQAIGWYGELALCVTPLATPRVVLRDADDDHVIACAITAQVDAIVSGDNDLLSLTQYQGIAMLTPVQAIARIK
jgi:putative PIN family toxin of toxin-antitoxin system